MRTLLAWLGVATLVVLSSARSAHAGDPLKPYVVFVLDTSGSMEEATNSGIPSCAGGTDTKLDHAKCAIQNIVNSYGDMVFALGRFRMSMSGTTTAATFPTGCSTSQGGCTSTDEKFELLTPLVDGNNSTSATWVNETGNTCTATGTDPEIWLGADATPIAGSLAGARSYWRGTQAANGTTIWPALDGSMNPNPGFSPIVNDPTNLAFLVDPAHRDPSMPGHSCNSVRTGVNACNATAGCIGPTCCCLEQCRPYIVIMLTDGDASCGNAVTATTNLLANDIVTGTGANQATRRYRIETKPIGFGKTAPDTEIEDMAHAGGAPDITVPNLLEGYYANDEASLQLAISSILDDAIRTELCNGSDDDCDLAVDEGFNTGVACDNGRLGVCRRTGVTECSGDFTGVVCNAAAGPAAGTEVCNSLDDDCDGKIDEGVAGGCTTCNPQGESCNAMDDDCDTRIDENLTRPCGTGVCQGTETCTGNNIWTGCTAPVAGTETCNGLDDDCDGIRDGFTQACSTIVGTFPAGDPRNNPGNTICPPGATCPPLSSNAGCLAEGPAICLCHPGNKTCPANIGPPNAFGTCLGEVKPVAEVCNGLDDDCDGVVDEGTGGADCSTNCGTGTTACTNGMLTCNATTQPTDDTCDNNDDDCDGMIDEDFVPTVCGQGPPATVCMGTEQCIAGIETCVGEPIGTESCNCEDDDCDTQVDENVTCGGGASCIQCQCAQPCQGGEFPCPDGKACSNGFCIADPCFGVDCPVVGGAAQECVIQGNAGVCVDSCSLANCTGGLMCQPSTGDCLPDNCASFPEKCTADQNCVAGVCVSNPCANVDCPTEQYCVGGQCFGSCSGIDCPDGQRCRMGACEADPCGMACPFGQVCNDDTGTCGSNPCMNVICQAGQWCDPNGDGQCEDDPCIGTTCPDPAQICRGGTCDDRPAATNDAGPEEHVTTGGGGGCSTTGGGDGLALLMIGLALATRRRMRRTHGGVA